MPRSVVNVPGDYFSMAGFEVTTYGRFWVFPEEFARRLSRRQGCPSERYSLRKEERS
jgi:hypothetical protein